MVTQIRERRCAMNSLIMKMCLLLVIGLLIIGCEKKEGQTTEPVTVETIQAAKEQPATASAGQPQTICPLMGGKINKDIYADYDGKRVYFCCAGCVDAFKKGPAKYLKQMEDKGIVLDKAE